MSTHHPWHRVTLSVWELRLLRQVEQRLIEYSQAAVPAGRIIRMVQGTGRLVRSTGVVGRALGEQVETACRAAIEPDLPPTADQRRRHHQASTGAVR